MIIDNMMKHLPNSPFMDVVNYILSHTDGDSKVFKRTYIEIQKETGVSQVTISKVIRTMENLQFLEKLGKGCWKNNMILGKSRVADDGYDNLYIISRNNE